jgi:pimeloyl-ACP methyl ester carboxylesterase
MALAGTGERLDAVLAHNVLDPALPSTVAVTRFPEWLARVYPAVVAAFRAGGRLLPRVPVPFDAYLDMARVAQDPANAEYFYTDPLSLRAYPLGFMASLFAADLSGMTDGRIRCPVTVVAGRGDPLFPLTYTRQVYDRIVAPGKELLVVDSHAHLLFNEDLDAVLPAAAGPADAAVVNRPVGVMCPGAMPTVPGADDLRPCATSGVGGHRGQ